MKISQNKIKPYYIISTTIFLYWLLNHYSPVQAQILNDYEEQVINVSSFSGGIGIILIISAVFSAIRLYWFVTGILLIYSALQSYVYQGNNNIIQLGIFFSFKSFMALTIINFAYSLVQPIIEQGL